MEKLCIFFVLALMSSQAMGMTFRHKRQATQEGALDDRYGWARPWDFPNFPSNPNGQFPNQGQLPGQEQLPGQGQFPGQSQFPGQGQQQTTTPAPNNGGATTVSPTIQACIRACQVTPEYNPVCGTDFLTYTNPGRLYCAQACGINVSLLRASPCPTTTVAPVVAN